jgi:OOP family OmpA-OmpF porin
MRKAAILVVAAICVLAAGAALALAGEAAREDPKAPCYSWPAVDFDKDGVFDRLDHCPGTLLGCDVDQYGCSLDADGDGVCDGLDRCPGTPAGQKVDKEGCSAAQLAASAPPPPPPPPVEKPAPPPPPPPPPPTRSERELLEQARIRLENVYFETGSAKLLPESEASLNEAGEALEKYPDLRVEVEGHTDTRGAAAYNRRLSQSRAESVRAYLLEHFRLRGENITAKGYGESQPLTRERNQEELRQNRRVELRVLNPDVLPKNVKVEERR